jgi:hypothetical protein
MPDCNGDFGMMDRLRICLTAIGLYCFAACSFAFCADSNSPASRIVDSNFVIVLNIADPNTLKIQDSNKPAIEPNSPAPVKINANIPASDRVAKAKLWALACGAMLIELSNGSHQQLGGCDVDSKSGTACQNTLLKQLSHRK